MNSVEKAKITVDFHHVTVPIKNINAIRALNINRKVLEQLRRYKHFTGGLGNFGTLLAKILDHVENDKNLDMPLKSEFFEISYRIHTHYVEIWNVATPGIPFYEPEPDPNPPGLSLTIILFDKSSTYFESEEFKKNLFYDLGLYDFEVDPRLKSESKTSTPKTSKVYRCGRNSKKWMLRKKYRDNAALLLKEVMDVKTCRWKSTSSLERKCSPVKKQIINNIYY